MKAKILILLSMLLFVVSCGTHPAQKDFEEKMKIIQSGDMSKFGKNERNIDAILEEFSKIYGEGMKKITYKVNKVESKGNTATLNVTVKAPNLTSYMGELQNKISEKMSKSMPQNNDELQKQIVQIGKDFFNEKFNSKDLKYSEKTIDIKYEKNDKKWVISDDNGEFFNLITFGLAN